MLPRGKQLQLISLPELQKLAISKKILFSSIDSNDEFLGIGTKQGQLLICQRPSHDLVKQLDASGEISLLKFSSNEGARIAAFGVGLTIFDPLVSQEPIFGYQDIKEQITAISWHNQENLFYGDRAGVIFRVVLPSKDGKESPGSVQEFFKADSAVVQLQLLGNTLLCSTTTRVYIIDVTKPDASIQVGKKLRQGIFGVCFEPNSKTSPPSLLSPRPGKRIWRAHSENGQVLATLKFKLPPPRTFSQPTANGFSTSYMDGKVPKFNEKNLQYAYVLPFLNGIISYREKSRVVFFIDTITVNIVEWFLDVPLLHSVAPTQTDCYLLHYKTDTPTGGADEALEISLLRAAPVADFVRGILNQPSTTPLDLAQCMGHVLRYNIEPSHLPVLLNLYDRLQVYKKKPIESTDASAGGDTEVEFEGFDVKLTSKFQKVVGVLKEEAAALAAAERKARQDELEKFYKLEKEHQELINQLREHQSQHSTLTSLHSQCASQLSLIQTQLDQAQSRIAEQDLSIQQYSQRCTSQEEELTALKEEHKELKEKTLQSLMSDLTVQKEKVLQLLTDVEAERTKYHELEKQSREKIAALEQGESEKRGTLEQTLRSKIQSLEETQRTQTEEAKALLAKLESSTETNKLLQTQVTSLKSESESLVQQLRHSQEQLIASQKTCLELRLTVQTTASEVQAQHHSSQLALQKQEQQILHLQEQIAELKAERVKAAEVEKEKLGKVEHQLAEMKAKKDEKEAEINKLSEEKRKGDEEYERVIEALKAENKSLVTLKDELKMEVDKIVSQSPSEGEASSSSASIVLKLSELKQQLEFKNHTIESLQKRVASQEKDFSKKIKELEDEKQLLVTEKEKVEKNLKAVEQTLEEEREEKREKIQELEAETKKVAKLQQEVAAVGAEIEAGTASKAALTSQLSKLTLQLTQEVAKTGDLTSKLTQTRQKLSDLTSEREAQVTLLEELKQTHATETQALVSQYEAKVVAVTAEKENRKTRSEEIEAECGRLREQLEQLIEREKDTHSRIEQGSKEKEDLGKLNAVLEERVNSLTEQLKTNEEKLRQTEEDLNQIKGKLSETSRQTDATSTQLSRKEEENRELVIQVAELKKQIEADALAHKKLLEEKEAQIEQTLAEYKEIANKNVKGIKDKAREKIAELTTQVTQLKAQNETLNTTLATERQERDTLTKTLTEERLEKEVLTKSLTEERLEREKLTMKQEAAASEEKTQLEQKLQESQESITRLEKLHEASRAQAEGLAQELAEAKKRVQEAKEESEKQVREMSESLEVRVQQRVKDLTESEAKLRRKISELTTQKEQALKSGNELSELVESLKADRVELVKSKVQLHQTVMQQTAEIEQLKSLSTTAENIRLTAQLEAAVTQKETLNREAKLLEREVKELQKKLELSSKSGQSALQKELQILKTQNEQLFEALGEKAKEISQYQDYRAHIRQKNTPAASASGSSASTSSSTSPTSPTSPSSPSVSSSS